MFRPATYVSPVPNYGTHGNVSYYNHAPAIPGQNDAGWVAAPNGSTIAFGHGSFSRLTQCWVQVDFTYFQTLVDIPLGTTLTTFSINFSGMDDGSLVTIFNSANPGGLVVPGSYVFLGGSGTTNLAPHIVAGETNRVVITQMDDCPVGNTLQSAVVNLNGTVIPPNSPPTVAANAASVSANEGPAGIANSGTYSDSNTGDNVSITASVGTVTKTGTNSGTWSWSNTAPNGPASYPVTITANDGNGGSAQTTFTATVLEAPPVLTVGGSATYTEDNAPVVIAPSLSLTDPGNDSIDGAKVSIGTNFNPSQDSLGIAGPLPGGISSSYNAASGVLTLSGVASPSDYQ
ncbi:MAG: hypothetical protein FJ319_11935 [SAR202 cluster bacterium]|nr:hypothetical protein [SAR202 cluster bacterium]